MPVFSSHGVTPMETTTSGAAGEITQLLRGFRPGDDEAASRLMRLIYPELKRLARTQLRRERAGHDLQPTALVHEAYLRLVAHECHSWGSRAHFYAAAANVMRRVLIDDARARQTRKRAGERVTLCLDHVVAVSDEQSADLLDLDEALSELERLSPRQARVVELRYFAGMSVPEVARVLDLNARSVDRDWAAARAWLRLRLGS
jgi:RNA polymerase sigma-70 factor, ECF subfamily